MSLKEYVGARYDLLVKNRREQEERMRRTQLAKYYFYEERETVLAEVVHAFEAVEFEKQKFDDSTLYFHNHLIEEKASVTFAVGESIRATITLNGNVLGHIDMLFDRNAPTVFPVFSEDLSSLGKEESFTEALDLLVQKSLHVRAVLLWD